ncbi:MAG: aspartate carbamoyltransferase [Candidatus Xenolissoclinum pacificiensis L6]|uniref:Aspartate carbamoyltransferase n=1 Tax=Candidatus Xenolissoclinum pacificiensis L6 TaxID=1401685 RepID=W2UYD1_9RICK|nr:MAG: aspartate carbamoyltransferase [Candidatus Xenolissoclinum pacificiensis L6]
MKHLVSIDDLTISDIDEICKIADVRSHQSSSCMANKSVVFLFFENSTRTHYSFSLAAKKLHAITETINTNTLSINKGESLTDTMLVFNNLKVNVVIIRSQINYLPYTLVTQSVDFSVINAGDGINEHPSQALIDFYTIRNNLSHKLKKILICGDILHSRVAHSNIKIFDKYNIDYATVSPPTLYKPLNKMHYSSVETALSSEYFDIIMIMRPQQERIKAGYISSYQEYTKYYGLNEQSLAKSKNPNIAIMHPGPVIRDLDISNTVLDNQMNYLLILKQSSNGLIIRQAILEFLSR